MNDVIILAIESHAVRSVLCEGKINGGKRMAKILTIASQKGGVGKSTTCVNLGIGLARKGKKVLLIDADAQGSMTACLGIAEPDELDITLYSANLAITAHKIIDNCLDSFKYDESVDILSDTQNA